MEGTSCIVSVFSQSPHDQDTFIKLYESPAASPTFPFTAFVPTTFLISGIQVLGFARLVFVLVLSKDMFALLLLIIHF